MKTLSKVQSPRGRWVLVAKPSTSLAEMPKKMTELEVAFGDVMAEMPRSMRFPSDLTRRLGRHGSGPQFITMAGLTKLVEFNKDDGLVVRKLEEFIEHITSEVHGDSEE